MNELDYFAYVAGDNRFQAWIEREKGELLKTLSVGEGPSLFRAQGRYKLLIEIEERLEKARNLR
jgi:hypothetical protein